MRRVVLIHNRALGDVTLMTAAVRDLKRAHGDKFQIRVETRWPDLWKNNPYLSPIPASGPGIERHELEYKKYISLAKRVPLHFLTAFHRLLEERLKVPVPVTEPHGDFHLTDEEKEKPLISGRYWLVFAGGKTDVTIKIWASQWYQEVVDRLREYGIHCVQSGAVGPKHIHPPLDGVLSVVGRGTPRDVLRQIYHCEGVICPITGPMHIAAVFHKPCVVIAGGREEHTWEAYHNFTPSSFGPQCAPVKVPHRYLHTLGQLDCCTTQGCWKNRIVPIEPVDLGRRKNKLCYYPESVGDQAVARCMKMITPLHVVNAVLSYYADGTLPPPG